MFTMSCVAARPGSLSMLLHWVVEHINEAEVVASNEQRAIRRHSEVIDVRLIDIGRAATITVFADLYVVRGPLFICSRRDSMCVLLFGFQAIEQQFVGAVSRTDVRAVQ